MIDLELQGQIELKSQNLPPAFPCDKSPQIEVCISKFWPKMHLSTVKVPIDFGLDWPWCSVLFLISNLFILPKFASHYSFASICIYLVRPLPVSAAHSTHHRTYTDSFMHADMSHHRPWNSLLLYLGWTIGVQWAVDSAIRIEFYKLLSVLVKLYTPHMP